jgi:membrane-associated phospholipid phosphatase
MKATWELVALALKFSMHVVMQFKHVLACPRPVEYSPRIQPVILTPGYSALPSGHATEATVFEYLALGLTKQAPGSPLATILKALTYRIAENRVVAGLHFPVDSEAGMCLGESLASYFLARCGMKTQPKFRSGKFSIDAGPGTTSSTFEDISLNAKAPILNWMLERAQTEVDELGFN